MSGALISSLQRASNNNNGYNNYNNNGHNQYNSDESEVGDNYNQRYSEHN